MAKNMKHYFQNGKEHKGNSHKMSNGKLHSGATHSKTSKPLFHFGKLSTAAKKTAKS